jgi:hypothetical protein
VDAITSPSTEALHVGDLLWSFVDKNDDQMTFRMVDGDALGHRRQHRRLTGLRRRDNKCALALADRHDQVDHPRGELLGDRFEQQPLLSMQRGASVEGGRSAASAGSRPFAASNRTSVW